MFKLSYQINSSSAANSSAPSVGQSAPHEHKNLSVTVSPVLVLAPMSGVTCSPFRRLIKELNPGAVGLLITEFISVEGMTRRGQRSLQMMTFKEIEKPLAIQIFGYDVNRMRDAALMVQDAGADVIDINCGCPAPKVVKRGGGCELMRQPEHLAKILRAVRAAVKIPLTLKMRSGWDEEHLNAPEVARIAESEGVDALAVHGRTRQQLYRGFADWTVVEKVASERKIPVLGSGDVVDLNSASVRLGLNLTTGKKTNRVAGLFIGRGALENPYVFRDIVEGASGHGGPVEGNFRGGSATSGGATAAGALGQEVAGESSLCRPSVKNATVAANVLERYIELLLESFPAHVCIGKVKQLGSQMLRGHEWRKDLLRALTLAQQAEVLKRAKQSDLPQSLQ